MAASDFISTAEAAQRLGVSAQRVRVLIGNGRLPALRVGGTWIIRTRDLQLVKHRKPGRPWPKKKGKK